MNYVVVVAKSSSVQALRKSLHRTLFCFRAAASGLAVDAFSVAVNSVGTGSAAALLDSLNGLRDGLPKIGLAGVAVEAGLAAGTGLAAGAGLEDATTLTVVVDGWDSASAVSTASSL